jgi:hypothetical protein
MSAIYLGYIKAVGAGIFKLHNYKKNRVLKMHKAFLDMKSNAFYRKNGVLIKRICFNFTRFQ